MRLGELELSRSSSFGALTTVLSFSILRSLSCSLLFVSVVIAQVIAAEFIGPVVSVLDSDTIDVLHNHHAEPIRLPQSQPQPNELLDPLKRRTAEPHIQCVLSCVIWKPQNNCRSQREDAN
jgi:hypothetical protein